MLNHDIRTTFTRVLVAFVNGDMSGTQVADYIAGKSPHWNIPTLPMKRRSAAHYKKLRDAATAELRRFIAQQRPPGGKATRGGDARRGPQWRWSEEVLAGERDDFAYRWLMRETVQPDLGLIALWGMWSSTARGGW